MPPVTEVTEEALSRFNEKGVREVPVAGGGGFMSAAEIALFYQALLQSGSMSGETIWKPETLKIATENRTRYMKNPLLGHSVNRDLGVIVAGDKSRNLRGFGHTNRAVVCAS